jgi:hypothetical protein
VRAVPHAAWFPAHACLPRCDGCIGVRRAHDWQTLTMTNQPSRNGAGMSFSSGSAVRRTANRTLHAIVASVRCVVLCGVVYGVHSPTPEHGGMARCAFRKCLQK